MVAAGNGERLREAAWVARCVGRPEEVPLHAGDVEDLSRYLEVRTLAAGQPLHRVGASPPSVCIVREGCLELVVPGRGQRVVIQVLRPGDVDGDAQLLLGMAMPYEARASTASVCLVIKAEEFDRLLSDHPVIARRWLTSVAARLARSQARLTMLLGRPLTSQVAQLLLDEHDEDSVVSFPQATLAAMLGARRPSVNRVLKDLRDEGIVEVAYGQVRIRDVRALARMANG